MADLTEPSSSLTLTSSYVSNGSSSPVPEDGNCFEAISLSRLSCNLDRLLIESDFDFSDAEIIVDGASVGVHRCILAARSRFFYELFPRDTIAATEKKGDSAKLRYEMADLVPDGRVGKEALMVIMSYLYTGKLKDAPIDASTCADDMCAHDFCRPAVDFVVELMYASSRFQISELVSLFQRRLLNFVDKAFVEDVISVLLVSFSSKLGQLQSHCVQRIARSDVDYVALEKEIPIELIDEIKLKRSLTNSIDPNASKMDPILERRIRRILRALDSDDVELLNLLLSESNVTLDDAHALHYAAAYCDSKVIAEVLNMGLANVNLKNGRGYSPLHIACIRREPAVIVSLLTKGASASETTADGQSAVSICRRLTRAKDYYAKIEQGQKSNKDRLCIDILEMEVRRSPLAGIKAVASPLLSEDIHMKLLYLENRVAFARLFFPSEAKIAMKIAQAETISEFTGLSTSRNASNLREVDLNETPSTQNKRLHSRVEALMKTVELGRRYFPRCSQVLDKFLEDDLPDLFYLQKGTPDEQKIKKMRFYELNEDVCKAFSKDKSQKGSSAFSSSSSSSSSKKVTRK